MGHSDRERHRDRDSRRRSIDEEPPPIGRVFRITDAQRQKVAKCLKYIDRARQGLENQHNSENREIIRELRTSADQIFDVVSDLEEAND